jgi:hypothetical protein
MPEAATATLESILSNREDVLKAAFKMILKCCRDKEDKQKPSWSFFAADLLAFLTHFATAKVKLASWKLNEAALEAIADPKVAERRKSLLDAHVAWWSSQRDLYFPLPFLEASTAIFLHDHFKSNPKLTRKKRSKAVSDCNWFNEVVKQVFEPLGVKSRPLEQSSLIQEVLKQEIPASSKVRSFLHTTDDKLIFIRKGIQDTRASRSSCWAFQDRRSKRDGIGRSTHFRLLCSFSRHYPSRSSSCFCSTCSTSCWT